MKIKPEKIRMKLMSLLILFVFVGLDQGTKNWALTSLGKGGVREVIPGFFQLHFVTNRGAAWSFLAGQEWGIGLLTFLSFVAFLFLLYFMLRASNLGSMLPFLLLASGCMGNLWDRFFHHQVIDFLSFQFGTYFFPIFNVADIFLVLGVLALIFLLLSERPPVQQTEGSISGNKEEEV